MNSTLANDSLRRRWRTVLVAGALVVSTVTAVAQGKAADVPALHEVALQLAHGIAPTPPFNRKRMLQVPAGFSIEVAAR
ncbi:MAG: hypothetical protein JWP36_2519, partial [Paucimonas sp.]|nr:hypothetical protein [Paucimonas sp.]